ncbi:transposase [bacterium endosymbiont of Bathymodiolus sp. 5 South]|jgi:putative transposase|uniref:transposase n=1 Tax=bacterium endosymbiont of Bathymodiolus sp. 5 South TaxID=1181670 RepID=UPI00111B8014|nr:transposase IS3/IS911 family protein [uncultured Gammaproteobacteria bacterium]
MSKKRTKYTSTFKTKLVLELLQNKSTLVQIASKHNILPQNLQNWKKTFLANAEIAMEPSKAVKEYKEELVKSQKQNERLTALVGEVTVEKEWLAKKLKSLGLSNRKQLVEFKLSSPHMPCSLLSVNQQCQSKHIKNTVINYEVLALITLTKFGLQTTLPQNL